MEHRRCRDECSLPRAGALDEQSDYPTNNLDWESRAATEFSPNPNIRRRDSDYPVNEAGTPIKPVMFNAVGGSTILWAAHFPRFTPRDFQVRTDDGVADDWPISYETLEPFFALNDQMMGVSGLAGDPAYPYHEPAAPPTALRRDGQRARTRIREARLALVAVRQRNHFAELQRSRRVHQPRAVHQRLLPRG